LTQRNTGARMHRGGPRILVWDWQFFQHNRNATGRPWLRPFRVLKKVTIFLVISNDCDIATGIISRAKMFRYKNEIKTSSVEKGSKNKLLYVPRRHVPPTLPWSTTELATAPSPRQLGCARSNSPAAFRHISA
jgi:hypothetical protein